MVTTLPRSPPTAKRLRYVDCAIDRRTQSWTPSMIESLRWAVVLDELNERQTDMATAAS